MRRLHLFTAIICLGWTVKAQDSLKTVDLDEVVVTGTKSEIPVEKSGKSIFKISREDIETSGARSVADVLNTVPGLQVDGNFGPLGTNISYFVRGASSKRTLVLIDGVPFNDPSGIDQTYDLRFLDLNQVESIEVLKGGLSTLYGTGAAAGVINITLKKSVSEKVSGSMSFEQGSFGTFGYNLNLAEKKGNFNYLISTGFKESDGFSAAEDQARTGNFDNDGFEGFNTLVRLGYDFSDDFSLNFTGAMDDFKNDFDAAEFTDDPNNTSSYRQWRYGISPRLKLGNSRLKADIFFSKLNRFFDTPSGFFPTQEYDADNIQGDILLDHNLTSSIKLIGGVNFQRLAFSQPDIEETSFSIIDPYVSLIFDQSNFNLQAGARLNNHSEYGNNFVWNVNPSYLIGLGANDLKLFGSYSTSFITPSLFQLFGQFGANPDLDPEASESIEGGFSILGDKMAFDAVYFYRKDDDLIIFGADGYVNAGQEIETDGLELSGKYTLNRQVEITGHYTYVRGLNDAILFRIPEHKYGFSVNYSPLEDLLLRASYLHTGDRPQPFFNPVTFESEIIDTERFDLVDLFVSYDIKRLNISFALNNAFDTEYVAIYGFTAVGRNYTAGLRYSFN